VRVFRQFGVLALLLMISLAPAMACIAPDEQMTTQERACCQMMKGDCGQMEMPASHGCCQKTPGIVHDSAMRTSPVTFHPIVQVAFVELSFELFPPSAKVTGWLKHPEHSPPKSPPSVISNLRV
jgi:hypothetical protein